MKRISYLLAATLLAGCPDNTEVTDGGIDASVIFEEVSVRDTGSPDVRETGSLDVPALIPDAAPDSPAACGGLGALCCEGDVCTEGVCLTTGPSAGRCEVERCGADGAACCVAGTPCETGLSCAGGACSSATCGNAAQPCCGGDCNNTGERLFCLSDVCVDCGELGEACCEGAGIACLGTNSCVDARCVTPICGMPGMPCCAGNTCDGSLECVRGEFNICTDTSACGNLDQACCAAGTGCVGSAPPGLECRFGMCTACGAAGQSCCNIGPGVAERCATGLSCGGGGTCG